MRTIALGIFLAGAALAAPDLLYQTQDNLMVNGQIKTTTLVQRIPAADLKQFDQALKAINRPAKSGRWYFDTERKSWVMSDEVGYEVAALKARLMYKEAVAKNLSEIWLPITYTKPSKGVEYYYRLGIRQMLAEATTYFSGSSYERRYNIGLGASRLNGTMVGKGEVFSFAQRMGPVTEAAGFKKAFVISGEQTIEGVGGGMCQVSTTLFRSAYFSGLSIVQRRPHSYQVRYYLPTGLDAAVFLPQLDLRFRNDTPGTILITSSVGRSSVTFRIFGTKDRTVSWSNPVTVRQTPARPTRYIVTNQLGRQQFRQVDFAAAGATVNVYRTIRFSDGRIAKDTLTSTYKPWGAVWLVGPGTRLRNGRVLYANTDDAPGNHTYSLPTQTASR